jgi:hypothetical protein
LKTLIGPLPRHAQTSDPMEFIVDDRRQLIERFIIAPPPGDE